MSLSKPRVSVIIPCFNGEEYISAAVRSVLSQTLKDIEVLVMDDGSTDASLEILSDIAAEDERLSVFKRDHQGQIKCVNELISLSSADLIARMDADDICMPQKLTLQYQYMQDNPDCVAVGGNYELINHLDMPIGEMHLPLSHEEIDAKNLRGHCSMHNPTVCMRRKTLDELGGYNKDFPAASDLELWLRMAEVGRLANIPEIVLKYRIHDKSISGSKAEMQTALQKKGCELAWERRGIEGVFEAGKGWRASGDRRSKVDYDLKYGWMAWKHKNFDTARYYFKQAVSKEFFRLEAWKLLYASTFRRG